MDDFHYRSIFQEEDPRVDENNPLYGMFYIEEGIRQANNIRQMGQEYLNYIDAIYRDTDYLGIHV